MSKVKFSIVSKVSLVACGTIFALLSSELLIRAFNVDLRLLRKTLYYQCSFLQFHRTSSDAQRLFELVPNISVQGISAGTHPKEIKYNDKIDVNINAHGFRGRGFEPTKKAGVFRIVIFGGSNTFGASVSDEDTYPVQMQKIFDEEYPGKVEVWNAGICAYVMSQDVAYAETVTKKFDPDLLILQDTNLGRRAFLYNVTIKELQELFSKNNELFIENIPLLWQQDVPATEKMLFFLVSTTSKMHRSLVSVSALYRTFCVSLYTCLGVSTNTPVDPITDKYSRFWNHMGQLIRIRELNLFTERHKDKKIILFFITDFAHQIGQLGIEMRDNMVDFVLNAKDKSPEYQETHPPSYVYAWYARELCDFLVQKGYITADSLNRKEPGSFL
jgi:hypothetical protein